MTVIHQKTTVTEDRKLHLEVELPTDCPLGEVEVTVSVSPKAKRNNGPQIVELLKKLAAIRGGGLASIADPVAWQRAEREDRPLP